MARIPGGRTRQELRGIAQQSGTMLHIAKPRRLARALQLRIVDGRGNGNRADAAGARDARESAGDCKRVSLTQLLMVGVELAGAQTPTQLPIDR